MELKIISQTKELFTGEVDWIMANTVKGQIQILPNHVNMVTQLDIGEIKYKLEGKTVSVASSGGLLVVRENKVMILADEAYLSEELASLDIDNVIKMAEEKKASFTLPAELIQIEKQIRFEKLKKKMSDNLG
ncbi:MAG TPA: ATP synthase F1 subunit epsilon [Candidatus Dojkabacteria bacterium]|nr:ATP synthase F1 subunit epsilon [Candidatus Dojkabacteria bacterium]